MKRCACGRFISPMKGPKCSRCTTLFNRNSLKIGKNAKLSQNLKGNDSKLKAVAAVCRAENDSTPSSSGVEGPSVVVDVERCDAPSDHNVEESEELDEISKEFAKEMSDLRQKINELKKHIAGTDHDAYNFQEQSASDTHVTSATDKAKDA